MPPALVEGHEALQARLAGATGMADDIDVHAVLADDDHVRDGMITERWAFMDATPPDVDDLFADLG